MTRISNVRNTTKFKRSIKAISPVIATLLMIAIAVVASLVVYAWVTGYMGNTTSKAGKAIQIQSFAVDNSNNLHVYVQNVGQGTAQLSAVYINDALKASPNNVIPEGNTVELVITGPYDTNTKLNIKVTTTDGTFMTASGKPGSGGSVSAVPAIALSPVTGPSATTVTVSGTNFAATSAITVRFNSVVMTTSPASVTTSAAGAFSCTFAVPTIAAGAYTVLATDASSGTGSATFTVTTVVVPAITLNPTTGPSATTVTVSGTNFAATSAITVRFNSVVMTTSPASVTTSAAGAFSCTFAVPTIAAGAYTVLATDASSGTGSATFTVTTVVVPAITLNPTTGPSATTVTVSGTNFAATSAITVRFNSVVMTTSPASVTTSAAGAFSCTFAVPTIAAGAYTVLATDASSGTGSATFTVTTSEVTFVSAGTASANEGSGTNDPNPSYPTGLQVNDLILLQVALSDTSTTPSTPAGFTLLFANPDSNGNQRQWIYYRFSTGSESGTITVSVSGSVMSMARMYAFRNVAASSFTEGGSFGSGTDNTIEGRSVTTTGSGRLAVSLIFVDNNQAVGDFTGETGGFNWAEVANGEFQYNGNDDGTLDLQTATMATAGTIANGVASLGGSDNWGNRALALIPL